jgi:hypothetical protein
MTPEQCAAESGTSLLVQIVLPLCLSSTAMRPHGPPGMQEGHVAVYDASQEVLDNAHVMPRRMGVQAFMRSGGQVMGLHEALRGGWAAAA